MTHKKAYLEADVSSNIILPKLVAKIYDNISKKQGMNSNEFVQNLLTNQVCNYATSGRYTDSIEESLAETVNALINKFIIRNHYIQRDGVVYYKVDVNATSKVIKDKVYLIFTELNIYEWFLLEELPQTEGLPLKLKMVIARKCSKAIVGEKEFLYLADLVLPENLQNQIPSNFKDSYTKLSEV